MILTLFIINFFTIPTFANPAAHVIVDGRLLQFDVPPTIIQGRTLVPLRGIFEALGVEPHWNSQTQTVTAQTGTTEIILPIGSRFPTVNGLPVELDVPGTIVEGRTLVPARFIAESLGAEVNWIQETRTVVITSKPEMVLDEKEETSYTIGLTWTTATGTGTYVGELFNGKPHGQGELSLLNGKKYIGAFKDGKYHGRGIIYDEKGRKSLDVDWKDGKPHGKGTFYYENGNKAYQGDYYNGYWTGKGTFYYENGNIMYEGDWKDSKQHGKGIMYYENGNKMYEGDWRNGVAHGKGTYFNEDGSVLLRVP